MRIAIIGAGLIGHSIALAARRANEVTDIVEIERNDPVNSARGADLIVLATPIDAIVTIIRSQGDVLGGATIVDTGSTKRAIVRAAREAGLNRFVGGHPMAGAAISGRASARADLFDGRPWFLVPDGARDSAVQTVERFVSTLGASPVVMTDDGAEHDRVMAAISHLPQVVASALMVVVAQAAGDHLQWAAGGLRDTTRLAQSDAAVWRSILASNADQVRPLLHHLTGHLQAIADGLEDGDAVCDLFEKANRARATLDE